MCILISMVGSSCATIFSKSNYPVAVNSNPVGATVTITDKKGKEVFKGQTPTTVTLKSGAGFFARAEYQVKFTANGYAEQILPITYKLNGWYWGNLLIGGFLGMLIIDPATGAMWKLDTPTVNATLQKTTAGLHSTPTLQVVDINSLTAAQRAQLVRLK
jgi:hypothetical protein